MKNTKVKTALTAVTLAAAALTTPLSAQAKDYNKKCADTSNAVIGAVVGGTAGAAIGDRIASRGNSTEVGILGAIIGGVAGAAIGDSASDCEKDRRFNDQRVTTVGYNPSRTRTSGVYRAPARTVYTSPRQVYSNPRTVYNTSYGNNSRNRTERRLYEIDRQIDDLRYEREELKRRRKYSHHRSSRVERRLDYISDCLKDLKRERKRIKQYGARNHNRRGY